MEKFIELLFPKLRPVIEEYLIAHHYTFLYKNLEFIYWAIALISIAALTKIFTTTYEIVRKSRIGVNSKDLLTYYSQKEIDFATTNFIATHSQSNDPSDYLEPRDALKKAIDRKNLIKYFKKEFSIKNASKRFFLILGDSGMGKTTFLINLYLKYKTSIFPINKKSIFLISLTDSNYREKIKDLHNASSGAILLLDAFDEDVASWHDPESSLQRLLKEVGGFSMVILSSRGHFFSSKIENVSKVETFSRLANKEQFNLNKLYLCPINDFAIYKYLLKKYILKKPLKIYKAYKIVKQCPNLMVRPMLLNNVDYLLKNGDRYAFTVEIYLRLILSWIKREKQFVDETSIISFSKDVAQYMYLHRNEHKGLYIPQNELDVFLNYSHITIDSVVMKTRSLLNRTFDKYKFSHKSIFEYFLALTKFDHIDFDYLHNMQLNNPFSLEGLSDSERFFRELFILKITIPYLEKYTSYSVDSYSFSKTKSLNLEGSKITTLLFLKEMDWLETINLNRTIVRNLKPLYSLKRLKRIDLKGTYYDLKKYYSESAEKELEELKDALPNVKIVY